MSLAVVQAAWAAGGGDVHAVAAPQPQQLGIVDVRFGFRAISMVRTASTGYRPAAVAGSADGAGAVVDGVGHASVISARVGRGFSIMGQHLRWQ